MPAQKQNPFSSRPPREDAPVRRPSQTYLEPEDWDDEDDYPEEDAHRVFGLGLQQADERQPAYGQGVVISLSAATLLLLAIIAIGDGTGDNPPISYIDNRLFWVIAAVLLVLTAFGAQYAERAAARTAEETDSNRPTNRLSTAWIVPAVSIFAAVMLVATFHNRWMLLFGPLIAFFGTAGALLSRDLLDEADEDSIRVASTIHTVVVHTIAFLAFSAVYLNKFDTWIAAPIVALIGGLLLLDTLERGGIESTIRLGMSILGAWILATVMMALNWWPTWGWTGGAVLLVVFYAMSGLLQVRAENREFRKREIIEFAGIGGLALLVLALRDVLL